MHHLTSFEALSIVLAFVCAGIQGYILYVLLQKKSPHLKIFATYTGFGVLLVIVGVSAYVFTGAAYFFVYWLLSFAYIGLEFGVMYEIFRNALKPYSALIDLGKLLFIWATIFLLAAATLTGLATSGSHTTQLQSSIGVVEHSMRLMQCGLLLLFFLFEKRLGLSWRSPNIFIGLGLGATAAVELSVSYLKVHFSSIECQLTMVSTASYIGILGFWAFCLALPQPARKNVLDSPSRLIFQRWNEALAAYAYSSQSAASGTVESFLPGIEKTVDRVMARRVQ